MFSETSEDWMRYKKAPGSTIFIEKRFIFKTLSKPFMKLVSSGKSTEF
jgi:hypothetical protein